jgi:hypothetical protein
MIEGMVNRTRVPFDDQPKRLPLDNSGKKAMLEAARYSLVSTPLPYPPQSNSPTIPTPTLGKFVDRHLIAIIQLFQQSGKVEYERDRLLGIANKLMNFQSGSQQPFALLFDFSALLVDNLN